MTNLTEQWKRGELEEGNYYIKDKYGNFIIAQYLPDYDYDHQDGRCLDGYRWCALGFDYDDLEQDSVVEVLAPVPSYEEWKIASEQLNKNGVWYTERSYKELSKEKRLLEVSVGNRDNTIQELREENAKLKELLARCSRMLDSISPFSDFSELDRDDLTREVSEVLK